MRVVLVDGCATDDDLRTALSPLQDLDLADLTLVGHGVAEAGCGSGWKGSLEAST